MNTAEPIRELEELEKFKNYYAYEKPNIRNYTLLCIGLNTALRISDMLMLRWGDVYDFEKINFEIIYSLASKKQGNTQVSI